MSTLFKKNWDAFVPLELNWNSKSGTHLSQCSLRAPGLHSAGMKRSKTRWTKGHIAHRTQKVGAGFFLGSRAPTTPPPFCNHLRVMSSSQKSDFISNPYHFLAMFGTFFVDSIRAIAGPFECLAVYQLATEDEPEPKVAHFTDCFHLKKSIYYCCVQQKVKNSYHDFLDRRSIGYAFLLWSNLSTPPIQVL